MSTPTPRHGERACYIRGCRRTECRDAHYRYMARYRYERAHGHSRRVDAGPASDQVQALITAGWSRMQIAEAARISHCCVRNLANRLYSDTSRDIARRVLALPVAPPPVGLGRFSPATGTVRRLRALMAIGHTLADISTACGIHRSNLGKIARTGPDRVETHTARAVANAYRQMFTRPGTSARPGASTRARYTAARLGWHGPLAWDDIDNPDEQPETDGVDASTEPKFTRADAQHVATEVQHLATFGVPAHEIAARVGRSESYIRDQIRGARAPGWRNRLEEAA